MSTTGDRMTVAPVAFVGRRRPTTGPGDSGGPDRSSPDRPATAAADGRPARSVATDGSGFGVDGPVPPDRADVGPSGSVRVHGADGGLGGSASVHGADGGLGGSGSVDGAGGGLGGSGSVHDEAARAALARLRHEVAALGSVVVALSGGVDSALVAAVAHDVLGPDRALAVTAVSPSLAADELDGCAALVAELGLSWQQVRTSELADPRYVANDGDRCARCKDALLDAVVPLAEARGATVVLGVNVDDLGDHRPGQAVAAARGAVFPLVRAGLTKDLVRAASRVAGLPTWDKPAAACLASRVPYGTAVTAEVLATVGSAEAGLRRLGFDELRVRHVGDTARLEVPLAALADVVARRAEVVDVVRRAGYRYVTLDLEGLRSGNLNQALADAPR